MPEEKTPETSPEPPTVAALEEKPAWKGSRSSHKEIIAPDGHIVLSKEDAEASKTK